ncbi:MAG TPA: putative sugar nucleotidyl transferase [Longimicrobiales bacterium]|nr:putative sugar nucleotidyl transferase [Longimicrobiales bacterium]
MTSPRLVLFDDAIARAWRPLTLTRPAGELLFGTMTLRARLERAVGTPCHAHAVGHPLPGYTEPWAPPVIDPQALPDGPLVLLSSRLIAEDIDVPASPAILTAQGHVVGCCLGPDDPRPDPGFLEEPDAHAPGYTAHEVGGRLLHQVWHLMSQNPDRVAADLAGATADPVPEGVHAIGDGLVSLGSDVTIAPTAVLDTRNGPIRVEDGAEVAPFTCVQGPAWIGPRTALLGGRFEAVSIGPRCKVHGEVEASVILGYTNKAHDGFLGHAYLGMWVNLGALTTNSDLKNNYGSVRLWTPGGTVDTGERKVGCFLGDHVKTAIGTMLNTGTVIEAGSNIFGGMPPKYVPPFSWGDPETAYGFEQFLETARTVMDRRDVALEDGQWRMLRHIWEQARG